MTLSRRTVFLSAVAASLVAFGPAAVAAIKPTAISNKVPGGGSILKPTDGTQTKARTTAAARAHLGIGLYKDRAFIFSEAGDGKQIDKADIALGGGYALGQSITVYLQAKGALHRLVLTAGGGKAVHAIDVDFKSGRMKQVAASGPDALKALGISAKDLQGEIALKPGGTNVWEIEP